MKHFALMLICVALPCIALAPPATADGTPVTEDKGSIWKAAYHDGRAFWNVRDRLRKLAAEP
jgi:hypothetical protein